MLKHAECGGELKKRPGNGHWQCKACGGRVETRQGPPSPALNGRAPSRWNLDRYDGVGESR